MIRDSESPPHLHLPVGPVHQPHHGHSHEHAHNHAHLLAGVHGRIGLMFKLSLFFTALFVVVEFGAGVWANSLALISDAGHNLTDALALAFSWFALLMARRSPNYNKTYGYHRAGILAASLNAATLILIALYIFYEAAHRLFNPEPVNGLTVMVVAILGLALNAAIAFALSRVAGDDLNVRSALLHVVGDAVASAGAIVAGLATWLTGSALFDPAISILIGGFILWSSWSVIKESTNILLEGIPAGLDMISLMRDLMAVEGVQSVHDLHVWTIGSNFPALSCHILTGDSSLQEATATAQHIKQMLMTRYNIRHATLELECEACDMPDEVYCTVIKSTH